MPDVKEPVEIDEEDVRYMMDTFKITEDAAREAIRKGFRVKALRDGSAKNMLMKDSGISGRIDRMKKETKEILNHSTENS